MNGEAAYILTLSMKDIIAMRAGFRILCNCSIARDEAASMLVDSHRDKGVRQSRAYADSSFGGAK